MESFSSPRVRSARNRRQARRERAHTFEVLALTCIIIATLPIAFVMSVSGALITTPELHLLASDKTALIYVAVFGFGFLFAAIGFAIAHLINKR